MPSTRQQEFVSIDEIFEQAERKRQLEGDSGISSSEKLEHIDSNSNI